VFKPIFFWLVALPGALGLAQFLQYAPDLRWQDDIKSQIGFANPNKFAVTVELTGFTKDGSALPSVTVALPALGRQSASVLALFGRGDVAYLQSESPVEIGAYILYESSDDISMVPFSPAPGRRMFIPHIARDTDLFYTQTTIANFSQSALPLLSQPYADTLEDTPFRLEELQLEPATAENAWTQFFYDQIYGDQTSQLQWDIITTTADQGLVGVEHFGKAGTQRASLSLPRSPFQEMIISHISHDRAHFWTGLVLVNTKNGVVPVDIESFMEDGTPFQQLHFELGPYEKRTFLIGEDEELGISDVASWLRVLPYEQALVGYQIFGTPDQTFLSGMEPAMIPTNMVTLPHMPTNANQWSGFGIINPTDEDICVQIGGLDNEGHVVDVYDCKRLEPNSKFISTVEDMFGDKAWNISWVRLNTERGTMSAFSLVGDRDRTQLAGLQGISTFNRGGTLFSANFEHDSIDTLVDQGWQETQFDETLPYWWLDNFTIESYYEAVNGVKHLQCHRLPYDNQFFGFVDTVAFVSPFFEIPADEEELYLSFNLRLIDPEYANEHAIYAVIWREEGTSQWNWVGMDGAFIQYSMANKWGFTTTQHWNGEAHLMTPWMPFETQLPSNLAGKRIQIGLFYDLPVEHQEPDVPTSYLWADLIRITTDSVVPDFYRTRVRMGEGRGEGVFYYDIP